MKLQSNVTVIIPCYNDGQYIMEALQSIYKQTLLPEKIIIVDDGSDFATKKVLATIQHQLVQIIFQDNKGVSAARNRAISLAQTKYIVNLDADDYFEPSFIEKAIDILNKNEDIITVSSYYKVFKDGKTVKVVKPSGGKVKDFIVINNCIANSMLRKSAWETVKGFDENLEAGYEDWEFWISILKSGGRIHILPEILSHYRIKKTSRDQVALVNHDYDLRKYIYNKHKNIYEEYSEFYIFELLRQNSLLRTSIYKAKNSKEFNIGNLILFPLRAIKKRLSKNG